MVRYPKINGDTWFNTQPLAPLQLEGKVILVDFWTYTCVNCLRTLPYLKRWWNLYRDKGLIIIGVHTPEFEFEKNSSNVAAAIQQLQIDWPIVLDNNYNNWNNFANKYWPAKYLIDKNGYIVYQHFGEGAYDETEAVIQRLLKDTGEFNIGPIEKEDHIHASVCFIPTPELYCGYQRGFLSPPQEYMEEHVVEYKQIKEQEKDSVSLVGSFVAHKEYVESQQIGSHILLRFHATEVNCVLSPSGGRAVIEVAYNNQALSEEDKGADVLQTNTVLIDQPRMYNLIASKTPLDGMLRLSTVQGRIQAFAFTFSGCS